MSHLLKLIDLDNYSDCYRHSYRDKSSFNASSSHKQPVSRSFYFSPLYLL